jgi:hypothetical protein
MAKLVLAVTDMDEKLTRRPRFQFSIVLMLLLTALLAELFAAWRLAPKEAVYTPQNWTHIEEGMTEAEVEKIMGSFGGRFTHNGTTSLTYRRSAAGGEWSRLEIVIKNGLVVELRPSP